MMRVILISSFFFKEYLIRVKYKYNLIVFYNKLFCFYYFILKIIINIFLSNEGNMGNYTKCLG